MAEGALQGGLHLHVAKLGDVEVQVLQRLGRIYVARPPRPVGAPEPPNGRTGL